MKTHKLKLIRYNSDDCRITMTDGKTTKERIFLKEEIKQAMERFRFWLGIKPAKGKTYNITVQTEVERIER